MTIAACFLTPEGAVLGADSTTQQLLVSGERQVNRFFDGAQKIFEVGRPGEARLGLCTWGNGLLGSIAHRTVSALLADRIRPDSTVHAAAEALLGIAERPEATAGRVFVGYFLAGIDAETRRPAGYKIELRKAGEAPSIEPLTVGVPLFAGAPRFSQRVREGFDPELPELLKQLLRRRLGQVPRDFDQLFDEAFSDAKDQLPFTDTYGLPLRDAIDFVHAHLHLTVKTHKYLFAPPTCGGRIEMSVVPTDGPFRWVRQQRLDSGVREIDV